METALSDWRSFTHFNNPLKPFHRIFFNFSLSSAKLLNVEHVRESKFSISQIALKRDHNFPPSKVSSSFAQSFECEIDQTMHIMVDSHATHSSDSSILFTIWDEMKKSYLQLSSFKLLRARRRRSRRLMSERVYARASMSMILDKKRRGFHSISFIFIEREVKKLFQEIKRWRKFRQGMSTF